MHYKASQRNSNGTIAEPNFFAKRAEGAQKGGCKKVPDKKHPRVERLSDAFWYDGHIDALW